MTDINRARFTMKLMKFWLKAPYLHRPFLRPDIRKSLSYEETVEWYAAKNAEK